MKSSIVIAIVTAMSLATGACIPQKKSHPPASNPPPTVDAPSAPPVVIPDGTTVVPLCVSGVSSPTLFSYTSSCEKVMFSCQADASGVLDYARRNDTSDACSVKAPSLTLGGSVDQNFVVMSCTVSSGCVDNAPVSSVEISVSRPSYSAARAGDTCAIITQSGTRTVTLSGASAVQGDSTYVNSQIPSCEVVADSLNDTKPDGVDTAFLVKTCNVGAITEGNSLGCSDPVSPVTTASTSRPSYDDDCVYGSQTGTISIVDRKAVADFGSAPQALSCELARREKSFKAITAISPINCEVEDLVITKTFDTENHAGVDDRSVISSCAQHQGKSFSRAEVLVAEGNDGTCAFVLDKQFTYTLVAEGMIPSISVDAISIINGCTVTFSAPTGASFYSAAAPTSGLTCHDMHTPASVEKGLSVIPDAGSKLSVSAPSRYLTCSETTGGFLSFVSGRSNNCATQSLNLVTPYSAGVQGSDAYKNSSDVTTSLVTACDQERGLQYKGASVAQDNVQDQLVVTASCETEMALLHMTIASNKVVVPESPTLVSSCEAHFTPTSNLYKKRYADIDIGCENFLLTSGDPVVIDVITSGAITGSISSTTTYEKACRGVKRPPTITSLGIRHDSSVVQINKAILPDVIKTTYRPFPEDDEFLFTTWGPNAGGTAPTAQPQDDYYQDLKMTIYRAETAADCTPQNALAGEGPTVLDVYTYPNSTSPIDFNAVSSDPDQIQAYSDIPSGWFRVRLEGTVDKTNSITNGIVLTSDCSAAFYKQPEAPAKSCSSMLPSYNNFCKTQQSQEDCGYYLNYCEWK